MHHSHSEPFLSPSLAGPLELPGIVFVTCRPIVLLSESFCTLSTYFFPAQTTGNYGLHGYSGKITNYRLLRMRLVHMSSRALGFFRAWFNQPSRRAHILCGHKHMRSQTLFLTQENASQRGKRLLRSWWWLKTVLRPTARTVLRSCNLSSEVLGGSPLGPERAAVWMLLCLCLGD